MQLLMKMMLQIQEVYTVSGRTAKNMGREIHCELLSLEKCISLEKFLELKIIGV